MRKWRKMTWAVIAWTTLILVWMIGGAASNDCASETGSGLLSDQDAQAACEVGTGLGVVAIAFFGFFGFVFLSIIWFMTRPKTRDCPRCGNDVEKGVMQCKSCGYDFNQMGVAA
jgi:hypothetical protein